MAYMTSAYREGFERGLSRGLLKRIEAILDNRFGEAGTPLMPTLRQIDNSAQLEAILYALKTVATPDDVRAFVEQGK